MHLLLDALYVIPILVAAYLMKMLDLHGALLYFELMACSIGDGLMFVLNEIRRPFLWLRERRPYFRYEVSATCDLGSDLRPM